MRISELNYELLSEDEQYSIVMSNIYDMAKTVPNELEKADLIVVLGCSPIPLRYRILKMMELVKLGYSKNVLFSGGKGWQKLFRKQDLETGKVVINEAKKEELLRAVRSCIDENLLSSDEEKILDMSEAELMKLIVISNGGLSNTKIFHEPFSYNTRENIEYGRTLINELLKRKEINKLERMIIVTSSFHCKRAYLTFKKAFQDIEILACPATLDLEDRGTSLGRAMLSNAYYNKQIHLECNAIVNYSKNGSILDAELIDLVPKEVAFEIEERQKV